jgi:hypothetical protein
METFRAQQSNFTRCLSQFLSAWTKRGPQCKRNILSGVFLAVATLVAFAALNGQQITFIANGTFFANPGGASETHSTTGGGIDLTLRDHSFRVWAPTARSCGSCRQPSDGMSIAAANVQQQFDQTQGMDPIFPHR